LSETGAIELYPYQKRWVTDRSRFKIGLWPRQSGKSFGTGLEVALDASENARSLWVVLSRGERQSRENMDKVRMHLRAMNVAAAEIEGEYVIDDRSFRQLEFRLNNGSRIVGLPANPDTARGFTGSVLLDEFAFHQDSRKIWTALYPTITRGHKIRIVSTPNGMQNKFYELWTDQGNGFSRHKLDVYTAVAEGLEADVDELRRGIGDPDAWAQEYECRFIDEATAFLTYDMIASCEDPDLVQWDDPPAKPSLFGGIDIGRRRDLTVGWFDEPVGDVLVTRRLIVIEKATFAEQKRILWPWIAGCRRCCIDATGLGMQIAEEAQAAFGAYRVEPVTFTAKVKEELAYPLRRKFEDRLLRNPADRKIRDDFHSVRKTTTLAGNIRFDAERSDKNGHADRFWSRALCTHAAGSGATLTTEYRPVGRRDMDWSHAEARDPWTGKRERRTAF